ncbi:hypothetical protein [Planctomyces sp. SH-PL14]|jgi:hypothetical protein|uniref:hypothetical protein n=1 Tax=Planctomyces sp. SH-PL14 TaxID=1632864 RepID=UPI00078BF259|nr:hypothetical protein [Planctomyces sp. SH-PL14]AMV19904.1 hypothetical protein VT03_18550 [Planctomyces sp. SH-PL14]
MQDRESELLGCAKAWSQRFNVPLAPLMERLHDAPAVHVQLPGHGQPQRAYLESDVRQRCADLIAAADDVATYGADRRWRGMPSSRAG